MPCKPSAARAREQQRVPADARTRRRKHGLVQGAKGHASLANLASCGHGYPAIATITSPNHIVPYNNPRAPLLKDRGEGMQVRADKRGETECGIAGRTRGPRARREEEIDGAIFAKEHFQTRS